MNIDNMLIGVYLAIFIVIVLTIWIVEDMSYYAKLNREIMKERKKEEEKILKEIENESTNK